MRDREMRAVACKARLGNNLPAVTTLDEARAYVRLMLPGGVHCPACGQHAKIYKRPLGSNMAAWLCALVRVTGGGKWVHVDSVRLRAGGKVRTARGGDYAKLLYWGLIECAENFDPKKRTSGFWRPTQAGVEFVRLQRMVPSHVYVYNGEPIAFSGSTTNIHTALRKRFDYSELMRVG